MKKIFTALTAFLALLIVEKSHATHALPLINMAGTWNGTCLTVNGSSDNKHNLWRYGLLHGGTNPLPDQWGCNVQPDCQYGAKA